MSFLWPLSCNKTAVLIPAGTAKEDQHWRPLLPLPGTTASIFRGLFQLPPHGVDMNAQIIVSLVSQQDHLLLAQTYGLHCLESRSHIQNEVLHLAFRRCDDFLGPADVVVGLTGDICPHHFCLGAVLTGATARCSEEVSKPLAVIQHGAVHRHSP